MSDCYPVEPDLQTLLESEARVTELEAALERLKTMAVAARERENSTKQLWADAVESIVDAAIAKEGE